MKSENLTIPFCWLGSKVRMRKNILGIIDGVPRSLYVEPFGGAGALFFAKEPEPSVYNDRNELLTNFFKVIRSEEKRRQIQELSRLTPSSSSFYCEFRDYCKTIDNGGDESDFYSLLNLNDYSKDVIKAFAFFYVMNNCFAGKYLDVFGVEYRGGGEHWVPRVYKNKALSLDLFADKMKFTQILNKDYKLILNNYDSESTLFYCDPPYETDVSKSYKSGWTSEDTKELISLLQTRKGNVVLSCYDGELYQPLLSAGFRKKKLKAFSSIAREKGRGARTECVYFKIEKPMFLF